MMAHIGGYTMTTWAGRLVQAARDVAMLQPEPGVDGHALALDAWRSRQCEIETSYDSTSASAALVLGENCRRLHGSAITCQDPLGLYWQSVMVLHCEYTVDVTIQGRYRTTIKWRLLPEWAAA